jgi:capsular exopolysaccharide synthesis family protein
MSREVAMEGIMPFQGAALPIATGRQGTITNSEGPPINLAALKNPSDYLRAVQRRVWLILAVAVPMAIACSMWALRQPRIYQAVAEVTIDPPRYDPMLSALVSRDIGRHDLHTQETYVPNLMAILRSRTLAEIVVSSSSLAAEVSQLDDAASELITNRLQVKPYPKTNMLYVALEGKDPSRTKKLLEELLQVFKETAEKENRDQVYATKEWANERLKSMKTSFVKLEDDILNYLRANRTIGPGGRNIFEEQYVNLGNMLTHKQMRIGELSQQLMVAQSFPKPDFRSDVNSPQQRIAVLEAEKKKWLRVLTKAHRTIRKDRFDSDPAAREYSQRIVEIEDEIYELRSLKTHMAPNPTAMILERYTQELEDDKSQHDAILAKMQESMPAQQKFLSMIEERNATRQAISEMDKNISAFEILAKSQKDSVRIPSSVVEPTVPVRPSRVLQIGIGLIVSLSLGIGLVFMLEHVDHAVRVPEHATHGLALPLLGVVPRIPRTALTHRAGHLWTVDNANSIEADAFRNVRASLLGVADRRGPIVSFLVTSPKAGDGKSTVALNLAATCARAGERTLLLDVDLRRPTLGEVFPPELGKESTTYGLIDVLQGSLPWQKTLRHTELCNLDFISTGDPREIPIEILGTLELRQLLAALSGHYDRVILDGPAVLGLADCRMLGRLVDSSVLVIRAGVHQLVTLQRAKSMLEQSHVPMAGVIINSLREDVQNWSSYRFEPGRLVHLRQDYRKDRVTQLLQSHTPNDSLVVAGASSS